MVCVVVGWLAARNDDDDSATPSPAAAEPSHAMAAAPTATTPMPEDPAPVVLAAPPDLRSTDGMARVVDEIRTRFGDTMGYELAITADRAMLARPDPTDEQSKLIYTYERGWGDPSTRSRSDTDDLVDIAAFDVAAAAAAVQAAPETLRITPADVDEIYFDVDHITEAPGPGALELLIRVGTTAGTDGWLYLDSAGSVKRVEFPS
ncbi:hypothetical protein [Mycolicibacterium agri]|uniref:hypothetical protein n=1 Tax=Mycolicibacterium agri TaxID=36811 RepID=UPI0013D20CDE|nr:hypothetical protein [Mycolicibacterium agri]